MLFYLVLLFLVACFSAGVSYSKKPIYSTSCKIITFALIFIPVAIRYDVGSDYFNYFDIYNLVKSQGPLITEPAYGLLNYLVYQCNGNGQWVLAISAFITLFFFFKNVENEKWFIYSILFIFILYTWYCSTIRQMLSASIAFYVWRELEKNKMKYPQACIWITIAFLFHYSAIFYPAFYFFSKKFSLTNKKAILICLTTLILTLSIGNQITVLITYILSNTLYGERYIGGVWFEPYELGSGIGVMLRYISYFCILSFFPTQKVKNGSFILTFFTFYALLDILAFQITIINRLGRGIIFSYFPIIYFLSTTSCKYKQVSSLILWIILTANFIKTLADGFNDCSPYFSIFNN